VIFWPASVSSLAAHPPVAPEPTTIASKGSLGAMICSIQWQVYGKSRVRRDRVQPCVIRHNGLRPGYALGPLHPETHFYKEAICHSPFQLCSTLSTLWSLILTR